MVMFASIPTKAIELYRAHQGNEKTRLPLSVQCTIKEGFGSRAAITGE